MSELRPDLKISDINAELKEGETFEYESDGSSCITLARNNLHTRPVPAAWRKPKVKKWIPKKVSELEAGDIMRFNGIILPIEDLNPCYHPENMPRMQIKVAGYADSIYSHMDEFVTVEVEE